MDPAPFMTSDEFDQLKDLVANCNDDTNQNETNCHNELKEMTTIRTEILE